MRSSTLKNFSLFVLLTLTAMGIALEATHGQAWAAVSIDECNKTANVEQCKKKFQECNKQPDPDLCKLSYLNTVAQLSTEKAPPKSDCNNTSDPSTCKAAYDKCGNKNDKETVNCKQNAISKQLQKQVTPAQTGIFNTGENKYKTINDICGGTINGVDQSVGISIKIGCRGKGNPIADALFAIIRILSSGVGIVIIGSIVYGGIQYIGSRGDPQSTALAVNRIRSSLFALLLFIFGYAILNYLIPAGFLG